MSLIALLLSLLLVTPLPLPAHAAHARIAPEETVLAVQALPLQLGAMPQGATRVRLLALTLQTSCTGDVTVTAIRVTKRGLGDSAAIEGVYLLRGYQRLTRAAKVSGADETAFLRPRNLVIPACEAWHLDVAADFSAEVAPGAQYRFEVRSSEDIETDASHIEGRFPLQSVGRAETAPLSSGTLTVGFLPLPGGIRPVVEDTLAKIEIAADNESHHLLQAITLTNDGSARDNEVRNLYLTRNRGRALTNTVARLERDEITLTFFQPFFLRRGQTISFELRGRVFTRDRTVNFILKEPSDLQAVSTRRAGRRFE